MQTTRRVGDRQPEAQRLQPEPALVVEGQGLVASGRMAEAVELHPPPLRARPGVDDDVEGHARPVIEVLLDPEVVLAGVGRGDLDDQDRPGGVLGELERPPVEVAGDAEEDRDVRAERPDARQVPVDPAVGQDHRLGVVGQPGLEDRLEIEAVVDVRRELHG